MSVDRDTGIYLRISLDATGDELGVTRQGEDNRKLADARGMNVVNEYVDNDLSASDENVTRPAFERLLQDIQAGTINTVVAWSIDRLCRNRRDRLRILEIGERHGLLLSFARGSDLDLATPSGRLTAEILASVARHEIEQMSDRRRRANEQKAAMGLPPGGKRPFGYCLHRKDPVSKVETSRTCGDPSCPGSYRSLVPVEADLIREAADRIAAGDGLWDVLARWRALGVTTTDGGPWHHSELRRLLCNPRYEGRRVHRGVDVGPGVWPAILDPDTAAVVRAVLTDSGRSRRGAPARSLLGGIARCGVCGLKVYGSQRSSGGAVYSCETRRHVAQLAEPVDLLVVDVLAARLALPDAADVFAAGRGGGGPDLAALRREEGALRARLDGLGEAFAAGEIDRQQMAVASARIRRDLEAVTRSLAGSVPSSMRRLLGAADIRAEILDAYESDQAYLRALLAEVAVVRLLSPGRGARRFRPETVLIEFR